jgi:hypothetical protein
LFTELVSGIAFFPNTIDAQHNSKQKLVSKIAFFPNTIDAQHNSKLKLVSGRLHFSQTSLMHSIIQN